MLTHIEIRDFALIEKIVMEPGKGLLVLTGETGAGKSILIDAIGALTGGRVLRDMVRHGQDQASVTAVFQVDPALIPPDLNDSLGLVDPNEPDRSENMLEIILSREIAAGGKSVCRINGRITTQANLRALAACLIDIHGQHDQQSIFRVDSHLALLDRYGGLAVAEARDIYQQVLRRYQTCVKEMKRLGSDPGERARQIDLLAYQVNEIRTAALKQNEDERLAARQKVLAHAETIQKQLQNAYDQLTGDQSESVLTGIGEVLVSLKEVHRHTDELLDVDEAVRNAQDILQTAASDLRAAAEQFEADPAMRARIEERLDLIYRLKRKYGGSLAAIEQYHMKAQARLDELNGGEARYAQLAEEQAKLEKALLEKAGILSEKRHEAATSLEKEIARELADLGMKSVRFSVLFEKVDLHAPAYPEQGLDDIEFLLSANPGEPMRPLARIASGGEASRIMLAIKSILAHVDQIPVLIFDEIDTGVSGQTAARVGEKMRQLAGERQVFCITHMAQIAAMADEHMLIEKQVADGRTRTALRRLTEQEQEQELARLLSGGIADETARSLASQMRSRASQPERGQH